MPAVACRALRPHLKPVLVTAKGGLSYSGCRRQGRGWDPGGGRGWGGIEQSPAFGVGDRVIREVSWGSKGGKGSGEWW